MSEPFNHGEILVRYRLIQQVTGAYIGWQILQTGHQRRRNNGRGQRPEHDRSQQSQPRHRFTIPDYGLACDTDALAETEFNPFGTNGRRILQVLSILITAVK